MQITTVTVIGANGTMGTNVSAIFASFGNCKVYMVSRSKEKSEQAKKRAILSVKSEGISKNLIPCEYLELESCVKDSDLVFESVAESIEVKREINKRVGSSMREQTLFFTGTSGLSINELAKELPEKSKKNYAGAHFFNPPYNLILCEFIPSEYMETSTVDFMCEYIEKTLRRCVVKLRDKPAFLGNRIGFQFINEAIQYAEKYKEQGGIDYIDALLGGFTGRSMPPILTADFVGLDVHKAIVDNLYFSTEDYAHKTFALPSFVETLIEQGKLGRKSREGLFKTVVNDKGEKEHLVYDIQKNTYRPIKRYTFSFIEEMITLLKSGNYKQAVETLQQETTNEGILCAEFLAKYVVYALSVVKEVAYDIFAADDVMAMGFGWLPPLAMIEAWGGEVQFYEFCEKVLDTEFKSKIELKLLIKDLPKSKYDYRRYFKAKY